MTDLISIVTTLYNYKQYIVDLIKSVQEQTYSNWEHIIIDDGSTDNPYEIIKPFLEDRRIKYIRFDKNQGYSYAKNEGIVRSKADYIVMIDADDMLTKDSIETRLACLKSSGKLWCHAKVWILNQEGKLKEHPSGSKKRMDEYSKKMDLTKQYHHRLIHPQSIMIQRGLHEKIGLYDESLRFSSDNEMFRRIIRFGYIPEFLPKFVAFYRTHPGRMKKSEYKIKRVKKVKEYIIKVVEKRFKEGVNKTNTRLLKGK
ncbi:MAG: glycosyltransferase [Candidatus Heimdallarchaeaceae archaeon]